MQTATSCDARDQRYIVKKDDALKSQRKSPTQTSSAFFSTLGFMTIGPFSRVQAQIQNDIEKLWESDMTRYLPREGISRIPDFYRCQPPKSNVLLMICTTKGVDFYGIKGMDLLTG